MITNGRFYTQITGDSAEGNEKYSSELKRCIEQAGQLCLDNINNEIYSPIMLLGSIQSGKTRAFIGLMSLCFDNDFDMTIILTKCSKALVSQTVSRMISEFSGFRSGNATVGDVMAQDILDIDFSGTETMSEKEAIVGKFLKRYPGKKRIIVVKKQADNVDRMNMFIRELIAQNVYKRILIVDDEADITSIGYEKIKQRDDISLRRISGAINTMRKQLHSNIEHALMQVTATPYALYLQPESFSDNNIMPIKPNRTVVLPTGKGYIGGQYYFIDSDDETAVHNKKAKYLPYIVEQEEMSILNGSRKNSGKRNVISDKRTVKIENFLRGQSKKSTFVLPSMRSWLFDMLVGAAIIQLNPGNEDYYVSAVLHAAIQKNLHKKERELIEGAINEVTAVLEENISDSDFRFFAEQSYNNLAQSVSAYGVLALPPLDAVINRIASVNSDGELEGLITEIDIKEINSDNDIMTLLNGNTGELKLETSITIFVGGQVLDRGITIPNIISFFYGRDPVTMQQDTVMQHCRMFGYRAPELLSVTRFYTTYRLFSDMKEITIRDNILRARMQKSDSSGEVIYLEAGGKIKSCSPQKVLASKINSILPEKRYLPVGFDINKKLANTTHDEILRELESLNAILTGANAVYENGSSTDGKYVVVDSETANELIKQAYSVIMPKDDGVCNEFRDLDPIFWFSMSDRLEKSGDRVALIVRTNRKLSKMKRNGTAYQDSPDDGKNEGALAKILRQKMPVLVLTEQTHPEWGAKFWWPVYYTPVDMNVGIYADESQRTGVGENIFSLSASAIEIESFPVVDNAGIDAELIAKLNDGVQNVREYYDSLFRIDNIPESGEKRKKIECAVVIMDEGFIGSKEDTERRLEKIYAEAEKILTEQEISMLRRDKILAYFSDLKDIHITDITREAAINEISKINKAVYKDKLQRLIDEAEDLVSFNLETFGCFTITGAGKCEIQLYYNTILNVCENHSVTAAAMFENVLSHEMFHALHYADVMTESGRWIYKNRDFMKQRAVKETLAEYFALCYSKDMIRDDSVIKYIRTIRKVENFPYDGGYSGCLILEEKERPDCRGAYNDLYSNMYTDSLSDMPKAYRDIETNI